MYTQSRLRKNKGKEKDIHNFSETQGTMTIFSITTLPLSNEVYIQVDYVLGTEI